MEQRHYELLFGVQKSVRYHMRRHRLYESREKGAKILALVIAPFIAMAAYYDLSEAWHIALSAVITSYAVWNLISQTLQMSQRHLDLARRFVDLEEQIVKCSNPSNEQLNEFTAMRLKIERDEPPKLRVFDIICHNEILLSKGYDRGELWSVPWWKEKVGLFYDIDDTDIVQVKDKRNKLWKWAKATLRNRRIAKQRRRNRTLCTVAK